MNTSRRSLLGLLASLPFMGWLKKDEPKPDLGFDWWGHDTTNWTIATEYCKPLYPDWVLIESSSKESPGIDSDGTAYKYISINQLWKEHNQALDFHLVKGPARIDVPPNFEGSIILKEAAYINGKLVPKGIRAEFGPNVIHVDPPMWVGSDQTEAEYEKWYLENHYPKKEST